MENLTFSLGSPVARSISFTDDGGLRVQLSTVGGWTEVYDLGPERAAEIWAWLGDMLMASDSADGAPAHALPV